MVMMIIFKKSTSFFILVLAILSYSYVVRSHSQLNQYIENIIDSNYEQLVNHADMVRNSQEYSDIYSSGDIMPGSLTEEGHLPSYECQHDNRKLKFKSTTKNSDSNSNSNINNNSQFLQKSNNDQLGQLDYNELKQQVDETKIDSIRVGFDTSAIYNKTDKYACYSVGQTISIDDGTVPCDNITDSCVYTCDANDILNDQLAGLIQNAIIKTISNVLSSLISVERVQGPLKLRPVYVNNECDYKYYIPDKYITTGIENTDLLLFITARPSAKKSTIAYALACSFPIYDLDAKFFGRPTAATINFNPRYFQAMILNPNPFLFREYIRVGLHEATHALGFSQLFYDSFVDSNGKRFESPIKVVQMTGTTPNGQSYSVSKKAISTPSIVQFVREHYNCQSISHQFVEDYGQTGTAMSHWEKRTVGEEYMLGYVQPVFPITNLTLSLLKDTGWYYPNTSYAEPLMWGKKLGCDWFDSCTPKSWNYTGYFCGASPNGKSCTPTRVGKGVCKVYSYVKDLNPEDQHFTNPKYGGYDSVANYCPFSDVMPNGADNTMFCVDEGNQKFADSSIGENYGQESRCFEFKTPSSSVSQACWTYRCSSERKLQVKLKTGWATCNYDNEVVTIDGISLICPAKFYPCDFTSIPLDFVEIDVTPTPSSNANSNILVDNWIRNLSFVLLSSFILFTKFII
ncbi:hypothetical protein CYY_001323 [Polysphondylium violaceum]|uniref:Peptidase M8 n=1 Tax=Polysphondylium violaceum TaxID=133409 RepID=A0A8J4Q294_9MYCE|nr:hypothetical protein CYY_001323 [Polysphondylium violaceum]